MWSLDTYILHLYNTIFLYIRRILYLDYVYGQTVTLSDSDLPYTCTADSSGTCSMTCDSKEELKEGTISCGNAGECYYYCEEKKCNKDGGKINARNANNLYVIVGTTNAEECLNGATVYLPNNGNAYFYTEGKPTKAFKGVNIQAGTNTRYVEIKINSSSTNAAEAMQDMTVNAANAEELNILINGNAAIGPDSTISCPDYPPGTTYTGSLEAPCVIDLGSGGYFNGYPTEIIAPNGFPKGVVFPSGNSGSGAWINCNGRVDDFNGNEEYWNYVTDLTSSAACYWTNDPSLSPTESPITTSTTSTPTTLEPSIDPTSSPSKNPTTSPSKNPSLSPSAYPTKSPIPEPTSSPNVTPNPTQQPTDPTPQPTKGPTDPNIIVGPGKPSPSPKPNGGDMIIDETTAPPTTAQQAVAPAAGNTISSTVTALIAGFSILICCFCMCAICGIWKYKQMKDEKDSEIFRIQSGKYNM